MRLSQHNVSRFCCATTMVTASEARDPDAHSRLQQSLVRKRSIVRLLRDVFVPNLRRPHLRPRGTMSGKSVRDTMTAVGVILSLLFVGMELRQNTLAVRATSLNDLATGSRDWTLAMASNPELSGVMVHWLRGGDLDPTESIMAHTAVIALLRNVENVFLQVEAGAVDESALLSYGFSGTGGPFLSPLFPDYWASIRSNFAPRFLLAFEAERGLAR